MKTTNFKFLMLLLAGSLFYTSCKKEDTPPVVEEEETVADGLYVLNEGNWGAGNTTLTYYNVATKTATTDYFFNKNGSGLGDTGNDMIKHGKKMYIVMNISSYVQVTDLAGTHVKKIDFKDAGGAARQPRYAVAYKNKVLVSSYDGTVAVIDTASLTIDKFITVGSNPEQMAISGDKLFVANSGGLNLVMDSTVSVIDLASYTEIFKIKVKQNPNAVVADNAGNVYVACIGNYGDVEPGLFKINAFTNVVTYRNDEIAVGDMRFHNGFLYTTGGYLGGAVVSKLNTATLTPEGTSFIKDGTTITTPYSLDIDTDNGDVYVTDAKNYTSSGEVFCFDKDGKKKFSFMTTPGITPTRVVIVR